MTNFSHKLILTNAKVSRLRKAFVNNSSANIKLSKTQLHKIGQWGVFLGWLFSTITKTDLPLMKRVLKPLVKCDLIPLGIIAAASATNAAIQRNTFGSGVTTLIISNEEMNDIIKIVKSLEESGLLIKSASETIKNESKDQKGWFLGMLFGMLGATLLGNLLTGKGTNRTG